MKFNFIITLCLSVISVSCSQDKFPETYLNKLICIEDLTGKYGIWDGNYGDIVAYDISSGEKFILTDDKFYNENPSFSATLNKILFESKRIDIRSHSGLSNHTNLFFLDVNDKKVTIIDNKDFIKRADMNEWNDFNSPKFSNSGDKFAALKIGKKDARRDMIVIYNFQTDSIYIHPKEYRSIMKLVWSNDDSKIFYDYLAENPFKDTKYNPFINHGIGMLDLSSHSDSTILIIDKMSAYLSDYLSDNIIYIKNALPFKGILEIYSMKYSKVIFSKPVNELGFQEIKSPVFKNDTSIFFIGNVNKIENKFDEDIYEMNLTTLDIKKISNTSNIKYSLHYCKN